VPREPCIVPGARERHISKLCLQKNGRANGGVRGCRAFVLFLPVFFVPNKPKPKGLLHKQLGHAEHASAPLRSPLPHSHSHNALLATACCCAPAGGPRRGPGAPPQHRAPASVHFEGGSRWQLEPGLLGPGVNVSCLVGRPAAEATAAAAVANQLLV
jgi:hypothetical protein